MNLVRLVQEASRVTDPPLSRRAAEHVIRAVADWIETGCQGVLTCDPETITRAMRDEIRFARNG